MLAHFYQVSEWSILNPPQVVMGRGCVGEGARESRRIRKDDTFALAPTGVQAPLSRVARAGAKPLCGQKDQIQETASAFVVLQNDMYV